MLSIDSHYMLTFYLLLGHLNAYITRSANTTSTSFNASFCFIHSLKLHLKKIGDTLCSLQQKTCLCLTRFKFTRLSQLQIYMKIGNKSKIVITCFVLNYLIWQTYRLHRNKLHLVECNNIVIKISQISNDIFSLKIKPKFDCNSWTV